MAMAGYDFLNGVLVIEVAQLGMDALGGYLADMGARVVKVEALPAGDPVRAAGDYALGAPDGVGFLHLRWNRGKQSIAIDLRTPDGVDLFRRLAGKAAVIIEGLKGGALERMGVGYQALRQDNPALVFCSISGLGLDGPYHRLRSHAVAYDAFGALLSGDAAAAPPSVDEFRPPSVGMHAPGLFAAVGVLAALVRARSTGQGAFIEVAAADVAANWSPDGVDAVVNASHCQRRDGFLDTTGRMMHWPRLAQYVTSDDRMLLLEALAWPTWAKFCRLVERDDLMTLHERLTDHVIYHETLRTEIAAIIRTRSCDAWMAALTAADISAMPVNDPQQLSDDPHYRARRNWYDADVPGVGRVRLSGTPIRVADAAFAPAAAPACGQHADTILAEIAGMDAAAIGALRRQGIIG